VIDEHRETRWLVMIIILLSAMLTGAYIGKLVREPQGPQLDIQSQGTAPPPRALRPLPSAATKEILAANGLAASIHLEEGSGISRKNHLTARGLAKVLELFAPHVGLLRGHDGGMNKTGTMEGVYTLAGYADTSSHGRVRFVISLTSNEGEMRFRLLRAIRSGL